MITKVTMKFEIEIEIETRVVFFSIDSKIFFQIFPLEQNHYFDEKCRKNILKK